MYLRAGAGHHGAKANNRHNPAPIPRSGTLSYVRVKT